MRRLFGEHATAGIAILLVMLAVLVRIMPHPANFAPVTAVAIFGGAVLPRRLAIVAPLLAMAVSDLIIGTYDWRIMLTVWTCYATTAYVSSHVLRRPRMTRGAVLTLAASLSFFVITNFAVWAASGMYAHTWTGLEECYLSALPFLRNTVLSDASYTVLLFGVLYTARMALERRVHMGVERKA